MDAIGANLPPVSAMKPLAAVPQASDAMTTARKFEELLGAMLVKEMRGTLSSGFFGSGASGDVYGGWLDEHVGAALAKRDAFHMEDMLRASIERKSRGAEAKK
jgi:Rod binding domain-containing protein